MLSESVSALINVFPVKQMTRQTGLVEFLEFLPACEADEAQKEAAEERSKAADVLLVILKQLDD